MIYLSSGTEIELLGADKPVGLSLGDLDLELPDNVNDFINVVSQSLTVSHVKVLSGSHINKIGWVPSQLIQRTEVPVANQ